MQASKLLPRNQTECLCTEVFVYWKKVVNSDCSVRKYELVKYTSNKITGLW